MTMVKFLACQLEENWCFFAAVVLVHLEQRKIEQLSDGFISQMYVSGCFSLPVHTHTVRDVLQNTDTQACTLAVHKSMAAHSVLQHSFSIQPS